ncbi:uncharacterized protein YukE [Crossiella equi]|uniref:Uncharacterized protein YukE n=1 Tax=Crossiella equi TaxID=130796 RepID=A0ABS5ADJ0_9PSEU|nr:hypothetical protein [Crossiella equi]MBP2474631.1 uncharacterized protein YukE [Crossiella equi]
MSGFKVEHTRLSRAATDFDDYAERAGTISQELTTKLAELGECWGSDAVGRAFARTHVNKADSTKRRLGRLPEDLTGVRGKLADTAEEYRGSEQDNTDGLRKA